MAVSAGCYPSRIASKRPITLEMSTCRPVSRTRTGLLALALYLIAAMAVAADLPTMTLSINGHKLVAEIAATTDQRMTGLMNRFSLKPDHGMLFVFRDKQSQAFWMKNTFIALSIAYIDDKGRIVNIEDMAPKTENTHPSNGPVLYALEMKKGWFRDHGIEAGALVNGLDKVAKAKE